MQLRLPGILFHTIKAQPGWSHLKRETVDVALVNEVSYSRRLFRIFHQDLPFTLTLKYAETKTTFTFNPVATSGGVGVSTGQRTVHEQDITYRLPSKAACQIEMDKIMEKQESLRLLAQQLAKEARALLIQEKYPHGLGHTQTIYKATL